MAGTRSAIHCPRSRLFAVLGRSWPDWRGGIVECEKCRDTAGAERAFQNLTGSGPSFCAWARSRVRGSTTGKPSSPKTGAMRSRAFAAISSRLIGFSAVPRTVPTRSLNVLPSVKINSTTASRRASKASSASSGTSSTLARWRKIAGPRKRSTLCADWM